MISRRSMLLAATSSVVVQPLARAQTGTSLDLGSMFPGLRFVDSSRQWSSVAQLTAQPSLVYLWASWCPICRGDLQNIAAVRNRLGREHSKFNLLLLNFLEPFDVGYNWAKGQGFDLPFSQSDSNDRSTPSISTVTGERFVFSRHTPQLYMLDSHRVVRWINRGAANQYESLVATLGLLGVGAS